MKRFNKSVAASLPGTADTTGTTVSPNPLKREQSYDSGPDPEAQLSSPHDRSTDADVKAPATKKRKLKTKTAPSKLSFGLDDEDETTHDANEKPTAPPNAKSSAIEPPTTTHDEIEQPKKRLRANTLLTTPAPRALTAAALRQEASQRAALRDEYRAQQEQVKETPIIIPFVFFEGTPTVTGRVRLKKGDTVDVLLSGAQKTLVREDYRKWVGLKLDDLMVVRGGVMVPHYLTVHYFILKGTRGPQGTLFDFSSEPPPTDSKGIEDDEEKMEGAEHDPNLTKIVDVKWYKEHKHIYPCNVWEWFDPHDPERDYGYAKTARRDAHGNSFFS